jgi:mannitol-specific phosphotransferase system IIBC component
MDSVIEKHKNNLLAFTAGVVVAVGVTWTVAGNLHAQKVDILETALRESQKKLEEAQLSLERAQTGAAATSASLKAEQDTHSRKQDLNLLLRSIDKEIVLKKKELIMASGISSTDQKGELYLQAEDELRSLQGRRNDVLAQLIRFPDTQ